MHGGKIPDEGEHGRQQGLDGDGPIPLHHLAQGDAIQIFHYHVGRAAFGKEIQNVYHGRDLIQGLKHGGFVEETLFPLGIGVLMLGAGGDAAIRRPNGLAQVGEILLYRHGDARGGLPPPVGDAEAALAQASVQPVTMAWALKQISPGQVGIQCLHVSFPAFLQSQRLPRESPGRSYPPPAALWAGWEIVWRRFSGRCRGWSPGPAKIVYHV